MVRRKGASSWSKIRVLQSLASASATRVISFHLLASQHFVIQLLSMPLEPPPFQNSQDGMAVCICFRDCGMSVCPLAHCR
ncbi:uncharacterized protein CLUP02_12414 [Colletotrichum lupini]|uniref:Uncharacterized protein n=1 Tax=Colletotrichum lupini TaxID=145971 RepID=A0A9Q8T266_9PEZI|nr:uncharacterized protein CLUP02_12414 [Colletotrichum lupini]UQC86912.1 hypothetical protein CLUP02_12414 [Colletotrichum lupini]